MTEKRYYVNEAFYYGFICGMLIVIIAILLIFIITMIMELIL